MNTQESERWNGNGLMRAMLRLAELLATVVLLSVSPALAGGTERLPDWVVKLNHPFQPPPQGVVPDAKTAIGIAYHVWCPMIVAAHARYHDAGDWKGPTEQDWQAHMVAHLDHGVWTVTEPDLPVGTVGGAIFVFIAQKDGRILHIILTQ